MCFANSSTIRYSLRHNDSADQILQVRLGCINRMISRSPSTGLPYEILQESSSSLLADGLFRLPLQSLEDPWLFEGYVVEVLSSFNVLGAIIPFDVIARKITSFAIQLAAGNYDVKFQLVVEIDYIQMFWRIDEETVVVEEARRGAPKSAIKKLMKQKFNGFEVEEEIGDCSICYDDLNNKKGRKKVIKIPCGHVYHKSCILTWLGMNNSCPLCRTPLQK